MALTVIANGEPMRDWNARLRINATACELAKALYYGRAEAFGLAVMAWEATDPATRHYFVGHALDVLEAIRPAGTGNRVFAALHAERARPAVVASLTPECPWGDPVIDARD